MVVTQHQGCKQPLHPEEEEEEEGFSEKAMLYNTQTSICEKHPTSSQLISLAQTWNKIFFYLPCVLNWVFCIEQYHNILTSTV